MYKREEASRIKHEFWTTFGRYMSPIPSAEGLRINWVNYHTGVKDLFFRMDAESRSGIISVSMEQRDKLVQELYYDQFVSMKMMLHDALQEEWKWELHALVDGKVISRIYKELPGVSIFNRDDWPAFISFFKPRIIALDAFWENAKWSFEAMK